MSTYSVAITLGPYSFTIDSGDPITDYAPVYVLDALKIEWANNESDPTPAQPPPVEASMKILTKDVVNLAALDVGLAAQLKVTSAGKLIGSFTGRIDDLVAVPVRRYNATTHLDEQWIRFDLLLSDFRVDLAEVPITLARPLEAGTARLNAIAAAIVAAGGPTVTVPGAAESTFEPLDAKDQSALDLLVDHIRQIRGPYVATRYIVVPETTAGALTNFKADAVLDVFAETWPPGKFKLVGGVLKIVFTEPPPGALLGYPMGLGVDGSRVYEPVNFRRSKILSPNTVTVSGVFGTLTRTNDATAEPVVLAISSTCSTLNDASFIIDTFLPLNPDVEPWYVDEFTWFPADADLAAMPFPVTEDTDTDNYSCYGAQVAVYDVPNNINPAGDSGFYAGTLDAAALEIVDGRLSISFKINRRLPLPNGEGGMAPVGVTWDDMKASYASTTWRTGAVVIDPTLSWNDLRLARRP